MWNWPVEGFNMLAHQKPSFHQSLLSTRSPVGAPEPVQAAP